MLIKRLGQLIGMFIGSMMSPSWIVMPVVLEPYFNIYKAQLGAEYMLMEVIRFQAMAETYPTEILCNLIPLLILVLTMSCLFIGMMGQLGGWVAMAMVAHPDGQSLHQRFQVTLSSMRIVSPWTR